MSLQMLSTLILTTFVLNFASASYPVGYLVTETYTGKKSNGDCIGGVSSVATLIGNCQVGVCSGSNPSCAASIKYVANNNHSSTGYILTYAEFTKTTCKASTVIPASISFKSVSTSCTNSVKQSYSTVSAFDKHSFHLQSRAGTLQYYYNEPTCAAPAPTVIYSTPDYCFGPNPYQLNGETVQTYYNFQFCSDSFYTVYEWIGKKCKGPKSGEQQFSSASCSQTTNPLTGVVSYITTDCILPTNAPQISPTPVPSLAPLTTTPTTVPSPLPQFPTGYLITSRYGSSLLGLTQSSCSGTVVASATLLGVCKVALCTLANKECVASLLYVDPADVASDGSSFTVTQKEFSSVDCIPTTTLPLPTNLESFVYSTACSNGVSYTYVPTTTALPISAFPTQPDGGVVQEMFKESSCSGLPAIVTYTAYDACLGPTFDNYGRPINFYSMGSCVGSTATVSEYTSNKCTGAVVNSTTITTSSCVDLSFTVADKSTPFLKISCVTPPV